MWNERCDNECLEPSCRFSDLFFKQEVASFIFELQFSLSLQKVNSLCFYSILNGNLP